MVKTIGELSAEIANMEGTAPENQLKIHLSLCSDTLTGLEPRERLNIVQRFLGLFGKHIVELDLVVHGDEYYLLQNQYRLPYLKTLSVKCLTGYQMFNFASKVSSRILQQLLIIYGRSLKTLEVTGTWSFEVNQEGYYRVEALETLKLNYSW